MNCGHDVGRPMGVADNISPKFAQSELPAKKCLPGRSSQGDDNFRFDEPNFTFKPGLARADFACARFGMKTSFSAWRGLPFEMFYSVSHINSGSIDACFRQSAVE